MDLIGTRAGARVLWRADVVMIARRLVAARSATSKAALHRQLRGFASGTTSVVWKVDPTRATWSPAVQAVVAATLATGDHAARLLAGATVTAFGPVARQRSISKLGIVDAAMLGSRLSRAARSGTPTSRIVARSVVARVYIRIRGAAQRGWSRTDGHWSTLAEHRALTNAARGLLRTQPHPATAGAVARLASALTSAPTVSFTTVPTGVFYPWPRDDAFDSQSLRIDVDKPASVRLVVYDDNGESVRSIEQDIAPGNVILAWDGAAADGRILGAGEYRYGIVARDLAGNELPVAGLEEFRIARDTTQPVVTSAKVQYLTSGALGPRLIATWAVTEVHSPRVRTYVILRAGTSTRSILLDEVARASTKRHAITLPPGSWRASFVFIDGSGNRASQPAGTLTVR